MKKTTKTSATKSSKRDLEKTVSVLKNQVTQGKSKLNKDQIADIISNKGKEHEYYEEYIHMFQSLKAQIRKLEKLQMLSPSTKNVYALNVMYSQQREIIADIRAISDYTENVNALMNKVIQPLFSSITQSNLDVFYHLRKLIIDISRDDATQKGLKQLEVLMRDQAHFLQDKYEQTSEKITLVVTEG